MLFPYINGQFIRVGIQKDRGQVLDGEFAFNKAELRDEMLFRDYIARPHEYRDNERDAKYANEDKEGGF